MSRGTRDSLYAIFDPMPLADEERAPAPDPSGNDSPTLRRPPLPPDYFPLDDEEESGEVKNSRRLDDLLEEMGVEDFEEDLDEEDEDLGSSSDEDADPDHEVAPEPSPVTTPASSSPSLYSHSTDEPPKRSYRSRPAEPPSGAVFRRVDLTEIKDPNESAHSPENVSVEIPVRKKKSTKLRPKRALSISSGLGGMMKNGILPTMNRSDPHEKESRESSSGDHARKKSARKSVLHKLPSFRSHSHKQSRVAASEEEVALSIERSREKRSRARQRRQRQSAAGSPSPLKKSTSHDPAEAITPTASPVPERKRKKRRRKTETPTEEAVSPTPSTELHSPLSAAATPSSSLPSSPVTPTPVPLPEEALSPALSLKNSLLEELAGGVLTTPRRLATHSQFHPHSLEENLLCLRTSFSDLDSLSPHELQESSHSDHEVAEPSSEAPSEDTPQPDVPLDFQDISDISIELLGSREAKSAGKAEDEQVLSTTQEHGEGLVMPTPESLITTHGTSSDADAQPPTSSALLAEDDSDLSAWEDTETRDQEGRWLFRPLENLPPPPPYQNLPKSYRCSQCTTIDLSAAYRNGPREA